MALQRFTRRAAEAAQGTGEAKDALAQMGIALRDQSGNLRRSEDLLGDVAEVFTPDCAADLSDARCGVDLTALEESGTVDVVLGATAFETTLAQATGWYDGGELTWTSGANADHTVAVRNWDAGPSPTTPRSRPLSAGPRP